METIILFLWFWVNLIFFFENIQIEKDGRAVIRSTWSLIRALFRDFTHSSRMQQLPAVPTPCSKFGIGTPSRRWPARMLLADGTTPHKVMKVSKNPASHAVPDVSFWKCRAKRSLEAMRNVLPRTSPSMIMSCSKCVLNMFLPIEKWQIRKKSWKYPHMKNVNKGKSENDSFNVYNLYL